MVFVSFSNYDLSLVETNVFKWKLQKINCDADIVQWETLLNLPELT